jgi:hypothetical protein
LVVLISCRRADAGKAAYVPRAVELPAVTTTTANTAAASCSTMAAH